MPVKIFDTVEMVSKEFTHFREAMLVAARDQELSSFWAFVGTKDIEGKEFENPRMMLLPASEIPSTDKDHIMGFLRFFAEKVGAIAVFSCMEAFIVKVQKKEDLGDVESLNDHPMKSEVVVAILESRSGSQFWTADIKQVSEGNRTVGDWENLEMDTMGGRLSGILPPIETAAN